MSTKRLQDQVVSGSDDKTLKVWDLNTGHCLKTLTGHTSSIHALAVLRNGQVISGSNDKTLKVWNVNTGQCLKTLTGHTGSIRALGILPTLPTHALSLTPHLGVSCLTHAPYGRWEQPSTQVVSGSDDKTLKVWDVDTGQCLKTLTGHEGSIHALGMLPHGQVISGSNDKTLKVWNVNTGQCLKTLTERIMENSSAIHALAVLPNGQVVSRSDNALTVWDVNTGQRLNRVEQRRSVSTGQRFKRVPQYSALEILPNGQVICNGTHRALTVDTELLYVWPRKLIYSREGRAAIENKLLTEALCHNYRKIQIQALDFSGAILSHSHLLIIREALLISARSDKIENIRPYNDDGFEPVATFIDDARISFELTPQLADIRGPDGGTILHYLVRLYSNPQHNKVSIEKLMRECLLLGVDNLVRDKEGKIAAQVASQMGAERLVALLQNNRPAFDVPQVVWEWCEQQGWNDVETIDGSKAEISLVKEKMTVRKSTPPKTQIVSVQNIGTDKRNITQTVETTTNTEQHTTLKLDRTLAASNKTLTAQVKSQEQLDSQRNQTVDSSSHEKTQSSSKSYTDTTQDTTRSVESSNWHVSATAEVGVSFAGSGAKVSITAGGGGSSEHSSEKTNVQSHTSTNQSGSRDMHSTQSTRAQEHSQRQSESNRAEQEQHKQLSIASGEQQQNRHNFSRREEYNVHFDKGYQFINSEKLTTWTEYKYIEMRYSLGGQVGIYRSSGKEMVDLPLCDIFNDRQFILTQVYPDYDWKFKQGNTVYCTIGGNYVEHNAVTEKINEEHPLYRIKRLIDELVMKENERRSKLESNSLAWMVNVTVDSNKTNPYVGTIEVRCNDNTDTKFLKKALKQIISFSSEESISVSKLHNGFTLFILTFNTPKNDFIPPFDEKIPTKAVQPKAAQPSIRPGLTRVNSGEFKLAFFNQQTLVDQKVKQQRQAAFLVCEVMKKIYFTQEEVQNKNQVIWFEVDKTTLQIRFSAQRLTDEHKIHINALRLALAAFLESVHDDKLPEAERLDVVGQWAFCLDFDKINENTIKAIENPSNHKYLVQRFNDLYVMYLGQFKLVEPNKLREKKDSLYQELKEPQEKSEIIALDF